MNGYLELKLAHELFRRPPQQLDDAECARLAAAADRQRRLEAQILASPEAAQALVSAAAIAARIAEIHARYPDPEAFHTDLAGIGLDRPGLEAEIARDLRIEGVLERVAASAPAVSEVDAEIFYRVHFARFARPERRSLRHILVTFGNRGERRAAESLLASLAVRLGGVAAFAAAAQRHSHCPTALDGGLLGTLPRGTLYTELDAVAFALPADAVAGPVETAAGLHLLRCDEIHPESVPAFEEVRGRIVQGLEDRRRTQAQKTWIAALR